jgi:hypothetical protein
MRRRNIREREEDVHHKIKDDSTKERKDTDFLTREGGQERSPSSTAYPNFHSKHNGLVLLFS